MVTKTLDLSLVVPYYNEMKRMEHHIATLSKHIGSLSNTEIIYVDDGSYDGGPTVLQYKLEQLKQVCAAPDIELQFISTPINSGKGCAIKTGVEKARGKYILFTDFDFAVSLNEIDNFMKEAKKYDQCAIIASRKEEGEHSQNATFLRRFLGSGFNFLMRLIVSLPIRDTQCGFKLFSHDLAKQVFPKVKIQGFAFDVEVLKRVIDLKHPVIEKGISLSHDDRDSTLNIFTDPFKMLWDLIKLRWRLFFEKN